MGYLNEFLALCALISAVATCFFWTKCRGNRIPISYGNYIAYQAKSWLLVSYYVSLLTFLGLLIIFSALLSPYQIEVAAFVKQEVNVLTLLSLAMAVATFCAQLSGDARQFKKISVIVSILFGCTLALTISSLVVNYTGSV